MLRKQPLPEWVSYLVKEFTKPPYFLQHIAQAGPSTTTSASNNQSAADTEGSDVTPLHEKPTNSAQNAARSSTASTARHGPSGDGARPERERPHRPDDSERSERPQSHRTQNAGEYVPTAHDADTGTGGHQRSWQSVLRQAGFPVQVARAFGWKVVSARPVYNVVKVTTKKKSYALKHTHLSPERVQFIQGAQKYLRRQGFDNLSTIAVTSKKEPCVVHDQQTYYATQWVDGNHVNFASAAHVGRLAKTLASFHELSRGYESDTYNPPQEFGIGSMMRRRLEDLHTLLTKVEAKKSPDNFDEIIIRLAPSLRTDADRSMRMVEDAMIRKFLLQDEDTPGLCHLDVIPGNFLVTAEKDICLLDLDLCTFAPRALDISHLLRRSLQQQNWRSEVAYSCFLQYDGVRPMLAEEYLLVNAMLLFPYRAWRVLHTRYRVFKDRSQTDDLRDFADQEPRRQSFLAAYSKQITRQVD